jgi:DNA-binding HxlR family transcriptional regulator
MRCLTAKPTQEPQERTFSCPSYLERTVELPEHTPSACRAREILDLVADKWSLYVITQLGPGPRRFNELKRSIEGISQRMLTVTLRGLERNGLVSRTMYPVMPPRVDYELTDLGRMLLNASLELIAWAEGHLSEIDTAREKYDAAEAEQARYRQR